MATASDAEILKRLRSICLGLPEATETTTFAAHPTFRAGKKTFAVFEPQPEHHAHRIVSFKTTLARQKELLEDSRFTPCPYGGRHGWTLLNVDRKIGWAQLEELLVESYRLFALRRMITALDAAGARASHDTPASAPKKPRVG